MVNLARFRRRVALFHLDLDVAKASVVARRAVERLTRADRVAAEADGAAQDQSSASRPWEALHTREQARAWLAGASEEELRAMAGHLLGDRPLCRDQADLKQRILLAANASEGLWRRLMRAMAEEAGPRMRWLPPVSSQGDRA